MLITPAQISLSAYDSCRFRLLDDAGDDVSARWEIRPGNVGSISPETGAYTAPRWIWFARNVVVCATVMSAPDGTAQRFYAEVKLSNLRALAWSLFLFLAAVATGLILILVGVAPRELREPRFEVAPREVVLTRGQSQQFLANRDVKWSQNAPDGLFIAPISPQVGAADAARRAAPSGSTGGAASSAAPSTAESPAAHNLGGAATVEGAGGRAGAMASAVGGEVAGGSSADEAGGVTDEVVVFATNKTNADWVDSARVKLHSQHYLRVEPARPTLAPGETLQLQLHTNLENVTFEPTIDGLCDNRGLCTSKSAPSTDQVVLVSAKSSDGMLRASVHVRFLGTRSGVLSPTLIALLFGALGGVLHAINSLIGYVGNDKFLGRWSFYYLARPFIGAAVGLIVMLALKGGLATDDLTSGDFYSLAAVAALAGLFSDPATHKLKEIFDVILGPKRDDRTNTMEGAAPRPPAPAAPVITKVTPPELLVGNAVKLVVTGSGFSSGSRAQIDGQDRETRLETATQLSVQLKAEDVASARQLAVVIIDGAARSAAQVIDVKKPAGG